jgi:hypothetical protein
MAGNGRSGRKPKPTGLKVLQGTFRSDRHGDEVQPDAGGWPEPPAHLGDDERALWDGLREHCEPWAAKSDWMAFNGVVSLMAKVLRVQAAQRATEDAGGPLSFKHVVQEKDGKETTIVEAKENPLWGTEAKFWKELRAYIGLTGLSPADRARMRVSDGSDTPANPLDRFLKKAK